MIHHKRYANTYPVWESNAVWLRPPSLFSLIFFGGGGLGRGVGKDIQRRTIRSLPNAHGIINFCVRYFLSTHKILENQDPCSFETSMDRQN